MKVFPLECFVVYGKSKLAVAEGNLQININEAKRTYEPKQKHPGYKKVLGQSEAAL